ncbi:unnamed protein product [Rotaria sp. Silwood1]|nr:unnamed protein product [Rotaria sp. Silwood1]
MGSRPSVPTSNISVQLNEHDKKTYQTGDSISGIIEFFNNAPTELRFSRMKGMFVGDCVYFTYHSNGQTTEIRTHTEPFFIVPLISGLLCEQGQHALAPGKHEWPFSFTLPHYLPPSVTQIRPNSQYIVYSIYFGIMRSERSRKYIHKTFTIPVQRSFESLNGTRVEDQKENRNGVRLRCYLENNLIIAGTTLAVEFEVSNLGKKELCLTEKNKEVLDEFVILLCLFNEATILTQADQTIAISVVESILLNLLSDLELERKKSERIYLLCDALISSLKTRFGGFYKHFSIETDNFLDGRFKFQWINDCVLLSDSTKNNIISTSKQYIVDACMKLTSKEKIVNADVQIITEENGSNKTTTIFSDKENKKRLFPSLQMGSFKRAKLDNSKPKSVVEELDCLLKEDNMTKNLIFKKVDSYQSLNKLANKIMCSCYISTN